MRIKTRYNKKSKKNALFTRRRSIAFFVFSLACLLVIIIFLIVLDNMRVVVKKESLAVPSLPSQMEGYTLLHISDLHGQYFGKEHSTIKNALAGRKYNIVLVTGDLIDSSCDIDCPQKRSVIELFQFFADEGKQVYYVLGNHDEARVHYENGQAVENEFYQALGDTGAVFLDSPQQISVGKEGYSIWLWPVELIGVSYEDASAVLEGSLSEDQLTLPQQLQKNQYEALVYAVENLLDRDVLLALAHYPLTEQRINDLQERMPESAVFLSRIDLSLAGHLHGGQIRLPFVGPVYVTSGAPGGRSFFPDKTLIRGMMDISGVKQHISGGLGSTGVGGTKFMKFRLLCPPEVSLITFTSSLTAR
ncbi:MAG: metallophosphoesterase [Christensenellales bacterium]|jgi:predicted MPP superfamily phosphohydrolase